LIAVESALHGLVEHLQALRCRQGQLIENHPCGDVAGQVLRVSLSDYPDPEKRAQLVAIRTGLSLPREQVDALTAAGKTMIGRDAPAIKAFLDFDMSTELAADRR
jgi:hypothetical protein